MNLKERGGCARAYRAPCDTASYTYIDGEQIMSSAPTYEDWKTNTPVSWEERTRRQDERVDYWITYHSAWTGGKGTWSAKAVRRAKITYSWGGGGIWHQIFQPESTNVSTNSVLLSISTQRTAKVNYPCTDGSIVLRCGQEHIPGPVWLPAKSPVNHLQERLNSVCRLPKSSCLSSYNSIHPSTPDSLILRQDNHNLRKRFSTDLSRPIHPLWKFYTSKYHLRRQTLRGSLMSKVPWGRGLAGLKPSMSRLYIIFHYFYFPSIFGDDTSGYNVEVLVWYAFSAAGKFASWLQKG